MQMFAHPGVIEYTPSGFVVTPTCIGNRRGTSIMATTSKKELINRIAKRTGTRQVLVKTVVCQFFDEIIAELAKGNRLEFRDFGVFETKISASRIAQNPKTLEKVHVPAKRRVVFKAGRLMREGLNSPIQEESAALGRQR